MPQCYFLFPSHDGPVANPFDIDDPLFRMSQFAVRLLKGSAESDTQTPDGDTETTSAGNVESDHSSDRPCDEALYRRWLHKQYWVSLEICSIAFVELVNRALVSDPPSEAHWDLAAFEAAHRALAAVFYVHYEATRSRPYFSWKKEMEALLTDWQDIAKDLWRGRVLNPKCHDMMQLPREDHWNVPLLATFLRERLWTYSPDMMEPPLELAEALSHPANFGRLYSDEMKLWVESAFRHYNVGEPELTGAVRLSGELEETMSDPSATRMSCDDERSRQSSYRFQIALSFPGEARSRVENVAELLGNSVPKESILYDKWLEAELARPNLDVYLTELYKNESLLVVVFLCANYAHKEWCGLEWRVVRELLKHKQEHRLMPLRLDDAEIPGFHSIDGYLDIRHLSDYEVAKAIMHRLASLC